MRASLRTVLAATFLCAACEKGPERVFTPNTGDISKQNGFEQDPPYTFGDPKKGYDGVTSGDSVGRARFCDSNERDAVIQQMVQKPIIPDQSVGGIPLWGSDGRPTNADELLGRPPEKFCNPDTIYLNAFAWGPTQEIIVYFNQETRLVEAVMAYKSYLGTFDGTYTSGGNKIPVRIRPRERITINGSELDQYASRADQSAKPRAWLNNQNVTAIYKMVRETFFGASPFPDDFDCVSSKICDLIYTTNNESNPQDTFIILQDSGIQVRVTPDGHVTFVYVEPIRVAPFESRATMSFAPENGSDMSFAFHSEIRSNCRLSFAEDVTFAEFRAKCIDEGDTKTLARANYDVDTQRDGVRAEFNGMTLGFFRPTSTKPVLKDGEHPADDDVLYSFGFSRSLQATVDEFRPLTLAQEYKARLERRLRDSIIASGVDTPPAEHPFATLQITLPQLSNEPQRIGELLTEDEGVSFVPGVLAQVLDVYDSLTPEQRAMVNPSVTDAVYLVEPFVDAVLFAFTHGASDAPDTFRAFQETADRRWSLGDAHFLRNGKRYAVQVQYSLDFGAVTYVSLERGFSEVDRLFQDVKTRLGSTDTFYSLGLSLDPSNPFGLNGTAIKVKGFDRRLKTLDVTLAVPSSTPEENTDMTDVVEASADTGLSLTVPGAPLEDRNGYMREIRGERFEFVPANIVRLYGKETAQVFYVEADGQIGRIEQLELKGGLELCPGLEIRYGENVRQRLQAWAQTSQRAYTDCEVVFNYSPNGNVLQSIASIANRRSVDVVAERAVSAAIWR